jgi:hypothetical protein
VPIAWQWIEMLGLLRRKQDELQNEADEPHPALALAVGLIYVFRTAAGARIMRELEAAIRKYAADPDALWHLVRHGEPRGEVIDTTASTVGPRLEAGERGDEKKRPGAT